MSERIGAKLAIVALLALVLLVGAGNLSATFIQNYSLRDQLNAQQAAQQRAQKAELARLCATFGKLAALKPPAGAPGHRARRASPSTHAGSRRKFAGGSPPPRCRVRST